MSKTLSHFSSFITLENFFCINRNYLIENPKQKIICNVIFISTTISLMSALIYDIATSNMNNEYARSFQLMLLTELALLSFEAKYRKKSFEAITRLDEKCAVNDEEYYVKIKREVRKINLLTAASVAIDIVGLFLLEIRPALIFILTILFAVHDSEMSFYSMLIEAINIRLSRLTEVNLNVGSKVYRHILIASSQLCAEFTQRNALSSAWTPIWMTLKFAEGRFFVLKVAARLQILAMLGITVITTVVYSLTVILADSNLVISLASYLIWRELKSLYSVWLVCYAAARTDSTCDKLAFALATALTFDPSISKEKNPKQHKTIRRWYAIVLNLRPRYMSRTILSIGLSVPLNLLDTSINYVLIIVQIYMEYK